MTTRAAPIRRRSLPGGAAPGLAAAALLAALLASPALAAVPSASRETLLQLRAHGEFATALAVADQLLADAADDVDLLLVKGQLEAFLGRHPAALATLERAAVLAPDYLDVRLMQARVHLYAARQDAALAVLRASVPPELPRPDAQLLLGQTALAAAEPELARAAFARAAEHEPAAGAAWLGLGDVARSTGSIAVAQLNYERALVVPETAPVARARLDDLAAASRRFELNTDLSLSRFDNDNDDWREGGISLGWRIDAHRQLTGGLAIADRYGSTDVQAGLVWSARLGERSGYFVGAAVTPAADFLPTWKLRGGFDRELYDLAGRGGSLALGAGIGFVEGALADYEDGTVPGFELGVVQYGWAGRAWLTAKVGGSFGTEGGFDPSFGLRLDLQVTEPSRVFLGLGQAYDNSSQGGGRTDSFFVGLDQALTDRLGLILNLALEDRDGDVRRTTIGLGLRVRF